SKMVETLTEKDPIACSDHSNFAEGSLTREDYILGLRYQAASPAMVSWFIYESDIIHIDEAVSDIGGPDHSEFGRPFNNRSRPVNAVDMRFTQIDDWNAAPRTLSHAPSRISAA